MIDSYVGLGSNLGDRQQQVTRAMDLLAGMPGIRGLRSSSLYESEPWGFKDQPPFVNAVARVETDLGPLQLMILLRRIEAMLGRTPTFRWGPREIDLDLLLYGSCQIQRRGLIVPHPSMHQRAFVLEPLREVWPDYRLPSGMTIDDAIARLAGQQKITRLPGGWSPPLVR